MFFEEMITGDSVDSKIYFDASCPKVSYNAVEVIELEEHAKSDKIHSTLLPE